MTAQTGKSCEINDNKLLLDRIIAQLGHATAPSERSKNCLRLASPSPVNPHYHYQ
jgi:hypothetical protein